jgi:hypothetical protein
MRVAYRSAITPQSVGGPISIKRLPGFIVMSGVFPTSRQLDEPAAAVVAMR